MAKTAPTEKAATPKLSDQFDALDGLIDDANDKHAAFTDLVAKTDAAKKDYDDAAARVKAAQGELAEKLGRIFPEPPPIPADFGRVR